ncbi:hypothetical protein BKA67DRAFT_259605 [Truncatella angustata]|uniref:Uncharacterized protein n=1 Tax=Truncatella angustata TaxID=152316 RepID=A0A9P8UKF5_9PEZI|nr:uncharacterized protein BKA67DRAFT_259605 [Truncatella angustata]KAH6653754.1 hypothetical protein BKA67DRAFT_259605 [Truncatella angustata]
MVLVSSDGRLVIRSELCVEGQAPYKRFATAFCTAIVALMTVYNAGFSTIGKNGTTNAQPERIMLIVAFLHVYYIVIVSLYWNRILAGQLCPFPVRRPWPGYTRHPLEQKPTSKPHVARFGIP